MIFGIGTDMIEINRVVKACERKTFLTKIYTEQEQKLLLSDIRKAASNFAVKEAVVKMFGTGFRAIAPNEIEVLRDNLGKPYVNLYGNAEILAKEHNVERIHVSITNTKELVSAYVIGEIIRE
ncbi:holo-ACP synthase [Lachnoclostridium phytofermentans]|uniref:Holo-[acyl-carrier-protein] synthase n=1 Tax=Lachnoclostridium phytofermentans (strain ATCC 700394 / DSM 18823 / ISDg) TaxID=357809 RepID=ACPS_LACP7|nr:holo-ACP synthase [Lachnoclostridium phytofermentans]A9KLF9.1 RecName: Full=Holo-[acyl-carrier-protein] synthase; Short=Holo-ACP synthase; AltName: Full=4'-phosphopantetheinyl transferase AcpS [Lachnoclostridium phytofermentans ISDg]ABX41288.1 holo-acyl-carrier-protein synthase [Lachnoclostridium phytofermentans ISDg]